MEIPLCETRLIYEYSKALSLSLTLLITIIIVPLASNAIPGGEIVQNP